MSSVRISLTVCLFRSWLETNTPYYYSECVRVMGPLVEQGLEKTRAGAAALSETTSQFVVWVKEQTPLVIDWVGVDVLCLSSE